MGEGAEGVSRMRSACQGCCELIERCDGGVEERTRNWRNSRATRVKFLRKRGYTSCWVRSSPRNSSEFNERPLHPPTKSICI